MSLQSFRNHYRLCRGLLSERLGNLARCPECDEIYATSVAFWCRDSEGLESMDVECPCCEVLS
jgi:hypothetical protein